MFTKRKSLPEKLVDAVASAFGKKNKSLPEKLVATVTNAVRDATRKAPSPEEVLEAADPTKLGAVTRFGKPAAVVAATVGAGALVNAARSGSGSAETQDAAESPDPAAP